MERGRVIIIPDENQILKSYFEKNIVVNHLEAYQAFSDEFHLGYHFKLEDYQNAPINIAKDGHLSLKTVDDSGFLVVYIPRVVTARQIEWFYKNISKFENFNTVGAFAIEDNEPTIVEGLDAINKVMNKRNMLYVRKEEEKNVRKEI